MNVAKAFATVTNLCMQAFQEIPDRISVENVVVTEFPQYPGCDTCVKVTLTKGKKRYFFYAACLDEENCLIYNFDGVPVSFTGKKNYFLVFLEIWAEGVKEEFAEEISLKIQGLEDVSITTNGTCWLITFNGRQEVDQSLIDELNAREPVQLALQLRTVD